jgi:hypothetical protein
MLEARIQSEPSLSSSGLSDQVSIARATISETSFADKLLKAANLTDKQVNDFVSNKNIDDFSITRIELQKIKMLIKKHPRPFRISEPGLIGFLQNTSITTKRAQTFKNQIK